MICTRTHNAMRKKPKQLLRKGMVSSSRNLIQLTFKMLYTQYAQHGYFFGYSAKNLIRVDSPFNWHEHVQPNKSISCAIFLKNRFISLFKQKKNSNRMALQKFPQITCNLKKSIHIFFAFSFHQLWSHVWFH